MNEDLKFYTTVFLIVAWSGLIIMGIVFMQSS